MAARTKSKVTRKYKTKYRVMNGPAYEAALRKRGDVTLWFDEDARAAWNASPSGRPGGQRRYSDLAILTALTTPRSLGVAALSWWRRSPRCTTSRSTWSSTRPA